jgi:hypothetical protein
MVRSEPKEPVRLPGPRCDHGLDMHWQACVECASVELRDQRIGLWMVPGLIATMAASAAILYAITVYLGH